MHYRTKIHKNIWLKKTFTCWTIFFHALLLQIPITCTKSGILSNWFLLIQISTWFFLYPQISLYIHLLRSLKTNPIFTSLLCWNYFPTLSKSQYLQSIQSFLPKLRSSRDKPSTTSVNNHTEVSVREESKETKRT